MISQVFTSSLTLSIFLFGFRLLTPQFAQPLYCLNEFVPSKKYLLIHSICNNNNAIHFVFKFFQNSDTEKKRKF